MFTLYRLTKKKNNRTGELFSVKYSKMLSFSQVAEALMGLIYHRPSGENFSSLTLYRIVKRSDAESVPDRASVHTRNTAFEAVSAPEQYCSAPLLKVERSVSDRFLKRSGSSLNTFMGAEIATEPRFGKRSFQIKRER